MYHTVAPAILEGVIMSLFENLLFVVVLVAALGMFARSVRRLVVTLQDVGKPLERFDRPLQRVRNVLRIAIGQTKLLREPFAGFLHVLIFWGFLVLLTAIGESIGMGLVPGFTMTWMGNAYRPLSFCQEFVAALVVVSVPYRSSAVSRRLRCGCRSRGMRSTMRCRSFP